jgi:hypothetical protein
MMCQIATQLLLCFDDLKRRIFYAWLVSALVTASCFIALVWVYSRKELNSQDGLRT